MQATPIKGAARVRATLSDAEEHDTRARVGRRYRPALKLCLCHADALHGVGSRGLHASTKGWTRRHKRDLSGGHDEADGTRQRTGHHVPGQMLSICHADNGHTRRCPNQTICTGEFTDRTGKRWTVDACAEHARGVGEQ